MHFTLVSITRKALEFPSVQSVTIPTKNGEITVFPNHESLITALVPGVLMVRADGGNTSYAIGGGIADITADHVTITADMVEDGVNLDLSAIQAKKEEARKLLETYRDNNETMDMEAYIELEQQFLRESAREQLAMR